MSKFKQIKFVLVVLTAILADADQLKEAAAQTVNVAVTVRCQPLVFVQTVMIVRIAIVELLEKDVQPIAIVPVNQNLTGH